MNMKTIMVIINYKTLKSIDKILKYYNQVNEQQKFDELPHNHTLVMCKHQWNVHPKVYRYSRCNKKGDFFK